VTTRLYLALLLAVSAFGRAVDLSGIWDFRYDPDNRGEAANWQSASTQGWTKIQVPGSYSQSMRNNLLYQGKAWYRTTFDAAIRPGERALLRFEGVAIRGKVWVNGILAGEHLFPYTGFAFDVTGLLKRGATNQLAVLADNQLLKDAIPDLVCTGWWNYGGINRGVFLDVVPEIYTTELSVTTKMVGTGWTLAVTAELLSRAGSVTEATADFALADPSGRTIWTNSTGDLFGVGQFTLRPPVAQLAHVAEWSPEHPNLYRLKLTVRSGGGTFEKTVAVGFRQIEVKGTQILLNGRSVFFKGVNYHEMYPGAGMTLTREQVRRDLADMKAMGCNFVRLAHYTHDQQVYELADEMGLMLWSEIPAWQTRADVLGSDEVWNTYGAPQLREMIAQRRTHPSVVVWSVGNEFPSDREPVARYVARATALVRELDPSRLVTFASDRRERDIAFDSADFIAINEYFGWYYGAISDLAANLDKIHEKWPAKPIVVSEFGAEGILGWKNPAPPDTGMDYSEDHQIKLIGTHLGYILDPARKSYMAGALLWVYADFPNPSAFGRSPAHPPIAAYMNCKGLVTDDRRHKRVWDTVRQAFQK
jgi:beta-glucuronidase